MPNSIPEFHFDPTYGPTIYLMSPDGLVEKQLYLNNDGTLSIGGSLFKVNGTNSISFTFATATTPYISKTTTTYSTMAYFLFPGTGIVGTPSAINMVSYLSSSTKTYTTRILRTDTGAVIAESTSFNNTVPQIKDLGTLSNLPTGETII